VQICSNTLKIKLLGGVIQPVKQQMNNQIKLEMVKESNQIYTTTDYFLFKKLGGNRSLNPHHLNGLKKAIKANYLYTIIIINEFFEIIDGQHRFEIISQLGLPLNYAICPGYGLKEVHILNQNNKRYSHDDYMNGYADDGIESYVLYREFYKKYKLTHVTCHSLLIGVLGIGKWQKDKFNEGLFKVTHLNQAIETAEKIVQISKYFSGYKNKSFSSAICQIFRNENFNFEEFMHKLSLQPTALKKCGDKDQYIELIEQIYNYRRGSNKVNLRF
jgi:hypothetical protein